MSDATFSLVTSLFTVGGLLGSLSANLVMDRYGRKGASRFSALFNIAGAAISGLAPSVAPMALGRFGFSFTFNDIPTYLCFLDSSWVLPLESVFVLAPFTFPRSHHHKSKAI